MSTALKWKLIVGFVLVFVAGGMAGAFFGAVHVRRAFFQGPPHGVISERILGRLRMELKLTPEQVAKMKPIADKTGAQLEQIRRDTGRRVHEAVIQSHQEMSSILTDEQRAKLQRIESRHWHHGGFHRRGESPMESPAP
jgi:Spy/CpxP family protein refolding chaperone